MQYAERYIQTAEKIIGQYDGEIPLQHHLKQFFAAEKKYGSRDRKAIAHACYCFFRLGRSLQDIPITDKIKTGIFLCSDTPGQWSSAFAEDWLTHWTSDIKERIAFVQTRLRFSVNEIFPLSAHLGESIDREMFLISHLIQPDLFLRTRPSRKEKAISALMAAGIEYKICGDDCLALPNSSKVENVILLNKDAVVQDLSSQRVATFLSDVRNERTKLRVWDCCAASGGKSILAADVLKEPQLTVSDVRPSILQNLKKRFGEAGISNYRSFVADLSSANTVVHDQYDLVICDVPCSGSGTWSRTPEQLSFFEERKLMHYTELQRKITAKVIPAVAPKGYLLYITCSVFREENEDMVAFILANSALTLSKMETLKGYDKKADTMFAALFTV